MFFPMVHHNSTDQKNSACANAVVLTGILAFLYSIFVIYGSLVPFKFAYRSFDDAIAAFRNIPFLNLGIDSRADWVANLLLFIPISFLYNQLATYNKTGLARHLISVAIFFLTVFLSFSMEFAQLFFPQRTVSQNDILAESIGGFIGIALQYFWGENLRSWLNKLSSHESIKSRTMRALNAYLFFFFLFSVLPLDLTISPFDIYRKWSDGRILLTPFGNLNQDLAKTTYELLTDFIVWFPVGLLWSFNTKLSIWKITALGLLAATFVELAQIFVYSRITDVTDIFMGGFGVAVGALTIRKGGLIRVKINQYPSTLWFLLWSFWAFLTLAIFWFPFDFDFSRVTLSSAGAALYQPLLVNYYFSSEFHATNELLRKIGFFLPGGILWGFAIHRDPGSKSMIDVKGGLAIATVSIIVEIGQLYLPLKFADLTDVLIQTSGGLLGLAIIRWVLSGNTGPCKTVLDDQAALPLLPAAKFQAQNNVPRPGWKPHLVTFACLVLATGTITNLPFIPYNVRELVLPGISGIFSIICLSMVIQWLINGNFIYLKWCDANSRMIVYLPLWLFCHGLVTWLLLRLAVPMESIYDIVGSPVLDWYWEWEIIGRFLALHEVFSIQLIGAIIVVAMMRFRINLVLLLTWIMWSLLLAWPLHWVVVDQAATDNLTELMRNGGTFSNSTILALGIISFFISGCLISNLMTFRSGYISTIVLSVTAIVFAVFFFWYGSEQFIVKYAKTFSAWQFLLSSDRQSYVSGVDLYIRLGLALIFLLGIFSLIQISFWKTKRLGNWF